MPRQRKIAASDAKRLFRNLVASSRTDALGPTRLATSFPEVAERLAFAIKATGVCVSTVSVACRHFLSVEALIEVLEARAADGRGCKDDANGTIIDEYSALLAGKVVAFSKRSATERHRIQAAFPEVDLMRVRKALISGRLSEDCVASVLEDRASYDAFFGKIRPVRR